MKKSTILLGIILGLFFLINSEVICEEASNCLTEQPKQFKWEITTINDVDGFKTYYTDERVIYTEEDATGHKHITKIEFKNLYTKTDVRYWEGPIKEMVPLNMIVIIIETTKDHKEHDTKIRRELETGAPFWAIELSGLNLYSRTWYSQQMPIYIDEEIVGRYINRSPYYNSPIGVTFEYPYTRDHSYKKISVPLIKSMTWLYVPMLVTAKSYTHKDYIYQIRYKKATKVVE